MNTSGKYLYIVIVPGLKGSELYQEESLGNERKRVWPPAIGVKGLYKVFRRRTWFSTYRDAELAGLVCKNLTVGNVVNSLKLYDILPVKQVYKPFIKYIEEAATTNSACRTTVLTFSYDFRQGVVPNAYNLISFLHQKIYVPACVDANERVKLVFIGHSFGGLVVRYAVEVISPDTSKLGQIESVICVATPHNGVADVIFNLVDTSTACHVLKATKYVNNQNDFESMYNRWYHSDIVLKNPVERQKLYKQFQCIYDLLPLNIIEYMLANTLQGSDMTMHTNLIHARSTVKALMPLPSNNVLGENFPHNTILINVGARRRIEVSNHDSQITANSIGDGTVTSCGSFIQKCDNSNSSNNGQGITNDSGRKAFTNMHLKICTHVCIKRLLQFLIRTAGKEYEWSMRKVDTTVNTLKEILVSPEIIKAGRLRMVEEARRVPPGFRRQQATSAAKYNCIDNFCWVNKREDSSDNLPQMTRTIFVAPIVK